MKKSSTFKIVTAGLMAALCFVGYAFFPAISITGSKIHLGNAFVILGAYLLGGVYGGLSGAIGLTLADILMGYAASAPRTFISKFLIGLIVGLIAHKIAHISQNHEKSYVLKWSTISAVAGLAFNCVFEPVLKYVWYTLLTPDAEKADSAIKALMTITAYTTVINALINAVVAIALYQFLRPVFLKLSPKDT